MIRTPLCATDTAPLLSEGGGSGWGRGDAVGARCGSPETVSGGSISVLFSEKGASRLRRSERKRALREEATGLQSHFDGGPTGPRPAAQTVSARGIQRGGRWIMKVGIGMIPLVLQYSAILNTSSTDVLLFQQRSSAFLPRTWLTVTGVSGRRWTCGTP